jgi:flagella synthesis protein FlgN
MSNNQRLWVELSAIFEQDIPTTSQLLDLLQQERSALETRNYDQFQHIIAQKQELVAQLESHSNNRQQLLLEAGFTDEPKTLSAADSQAPAVAKAWRQLGEQWRHCQELNEINERIAKRTRLVVGQVLDLLRGQNNSAKLYTSTGDAKNTSSGRTITSA